jgi:cupin 2 domain-containing protein
VNIYTLKNPKPDSEQFATLHQKHGIKIEAIRSHLLHPGEVYDQDEDEWVVLIRGNAQLLIQQKVLNLREGDSVFLPKHTPHQVLSTSGDALWLGVFSS